MRIRIGTRLIAGFMLVILLMVALSLYFTGISQRSLQQSVGKSSIFIAEEMLKRIHQGIYLKIEELQRLSEKRYIQEALSKSNREFEKLPDMKEYIIQEDKKWISAPKDQITPFMQALIRNELSDNLKRETALFYEKKYGYRIFEEILITNRFGANIAQTIKTTDYRQDDEQWWQITRSKGMYISDVEYDESSDAHGITIGIRIDDNTGDTLGILKAVLSVKEVIREAEIHVKKYETTSIMLITKDGLLLYRTSAFKFLEKLPNENLLNMIQSEKGFFTAEDGGIERLFSFARSKEYRELGGLEWILLVGHNIEEVLKPTFVLRNTMIAASLILVLISIIIALVISRSITEPLAKLSKGAEIIGKGDLRHRVALKSKDEIGELAVAFNQMTERRQVAEEALRESERRFRAVVDQAADAFFLSEKADGRIRDVNRSACDSLGYTRDELLSMYLSDIDVEVESHKHKQRFWDKLELGKSVTLEGRQRCKDGTTFPVEVRLGLLKLGDQTFMLGLARNITDRKQAEEELRKHREHLEELIRERTQELEMAQEELLKRERLAALGQLTATVAHEIRNPLGTVQNAIFTISNAIERNELGRIKRARQLAERNIKRCDEIIEELLDFTRERKMNLKPTDIDGWLGRVLDEHDIPEGIECIRELRCGIETPIDREQLRRAVLNVVTNAIHALRDEASQGNQLTVGTHVVGDRLEIRFNDMGCGISADVIDKIFEPLFSTKSFGIGLGMPIVKDIMKNHGGGVEIQSKIGKGTVVTLWLPTRISH